MLNVCLAIANKFWFLRYIHFVQQYITSSLSKIYPCTLCVRCFAYFSLFVRLYVCVFACESVFALHCRQVWITCVSKCVCVWLCVRRMHVSMLSAELVFQMVEIYWKQTTYGMCEWMRILAPMPRKSNHCLNACVWWFFKLSAILSVHWLIWKKKK